MTVPLVLHPPDAPPTEPEFVDLEGNAWRIELNVTLAREVKAATKVDLLHFEDARTLALLTDDETFVAVLWCLLERQAETAGVSEEDFGRGLGGDVLEAAYVALEVALINFSRPGKRAMIKSVLDRTRQAVTTTYEQATETINGPKTTAAIQRQARDAGSKIEAALISGSK